MRYKKKHHISWRLVEKDPVHDDFESGVVEVVRAVESLGEVYWASPPRPGLRGGYQICLCFDKKPSEELLLSWTQQLYDKGYLLAF